jgi:hypothetical protein
MKKLMALAAVLLFAAPAFALEVAGVNLADTAKVEGQDLKLNGAGIRTRVVFKVYVGALYLVQKTNAAAEAIGQAGAKRVAMHMLRDLRAEQVSEALNEGLKANHNAAELTALEPKIKELSTILASIGEVKRGSVIHLDYAPDKGTSVIVDGAAKGTVQGADFNKALLKVWLGDKPVDGALKKGMLGS